MQVCGVCQRFQVKQLRKVSEYNSLLSTKNVDIHVSPCYSVMLWLTTNAHCTPTWGLLSLFTSEQMCFCAFTQMNQDSWFIAKTETETSE